MIPDESLVVRAPGVVWRRSGPEVVVAPPGADELEVLSPTAAAVWHLLDAPRHVAELVEDLSALFGAPEAQIRPDVQALLGQLAGRRLIEEVADRDD